MAETLQQPRVIYVIVFRDLPFRVQCLNFLRSIAEAVSSFKVVDNGISWLWCRQNRPLVLYLMLMLIKRLYG